MIKAIRKMCTLRLRKVVGYNGRCNDIVCQLPAVAAGATRALVFFPGDVQDYPEVMEAHRQYKVFKPWNLVRTARSLGRHFPDHHILVVKPFRSINGINCYENFVACDEKGVPRHSPDHGALPHLQRLLEGVSRRLKEMSTAELEASLEIDTDGLHDSPEHRVNDNRLSKSCSEIGAQCHPKQGLSDTHPSSAQCQDEFSIADLSLVGFSSGCVVLNQLLHEFHHTSSEPQVSRFISRVQRVYWLDAGHGGENDTWLTSPPLLHTLANMEVEVWVHVSEYQVSDERRPWIARDEAVFSRTLRDLGAKIHRYEHAGDSLFAHFAVLDNFVPLQDHTTPSAAGRLDLDCT